MPMVDGSPCRSGMVYRMDLRRLELFLAFVDEGTVTAAAERERLAQPAMSRQLAALERQLRVQLFERSGNRITLTPAGRDFAVSARELVAQAGRTWAAARALAEGRVHQLVVAAPSSTMSALVAPYLARLPVIEPLILARELPVPELYTALHAGADMAISPVPPTGSLAWAPLGFVPLRAYVQAQHPWATRRREWVGLEELVAMRVFVLPRENSSRMALEAAMDRTGLAYDDVVECDVARVIQAHVAAGRGVGLVTDAGRFGTYGVKVAVDGPRGGEPLGVSVHAAWHRQHFAASYLQSLAQDMAAHLLATGLVVSRSAAVPRRAGEHAGRRSTPAPGPGA